MDMGLGIVLKRKNSNILKTNIVEFKNLKFQEYYKNYKSYLNVISDDKIINFINK